MGGLLHLVQRGGDWAGSQPAQAPPRFTKCNSRPINGQCTNHRIADCIMVRCSVVFNVPIKGLSERKNDFLAYLFISNMHPTPLLGGPRQNTAIRFGTRGQSNLTKSASRGGAHSPVRGHPRGSKFVPLNSWGRGSY